MITINNQNEMEKYYIKESNTYVFNDNVEFKCDIDVDSNITAYNITAYNINAGDINVGDIKACNINAWDIKACNINAWDITANNINAGGINAYDINAGDINANNITAYDINAYDITYYAVCFAYQNIECKSIQGNRNNCKHFCLDGKIKIKSEAKEMTVSEISKQLGYEVKIVKESK